MEAINIAQAGEIVAQKKEGLDFLLNKEEKTFREGSVNVLP